MGGHFTELLELREAFDGHELFYVLSRGLRTRSFPNAYLVRNIGKNPIKMVLCFLRILVIFHKERPQVIFSTGAEIAVPAFLLGKFLFRARLIYVECSAQVVRPSLTGRCVYWMSDLFLVQWPSLLPCYGKRARYCGGLI